MNEIIKSNGSNGIDAQSAAIKPTHSLGQETAVNGKNGSSQKPTHKSTDGRSLSDAMLGKYATRLGLHPNVLTGRPWNPDDGVVLYKEVSDPSGYEDVVTKTVGNNGSTHEAHYVAVRTDKPKSWRFPENRDRTALDTIPIHNATEKLHYHEYDPEVGTEFEIVVRGGLVVTNTLKETLKKEGAGTSAELLRDTTEINFDHSADTQSLAKSDLRALKAVSEEARKQGKALLPLSMHPADLNEEHYTDHPYVVGVVGRLGPELRIFAGSNSVQFTIENLSPEIGRKTQHDWYQVGPLLKALTLCAPVAYDTVNPNMKKVVMEKSRSDDLDQELLETLDYDEPLSVRESARLFGSALGGGPAQELFPISANDYYRAVEMTISHKQATPTPDRIGGKESARHHGNTRFRRTVGKHSATEITNLDTMAGDPIKIAAIKEMTRALNRKFNLLTEQELAEKAPALFRTNLTDAHLRELAIASLNIDNYGVAANVIGADGQKYNAGQLVNQLIEFAATPYDNDEKGIHIPALPKGVVEELKRSAFTPTSEVFASLTSTTVRVDSSGNNVVVPSIRGWYETGIGTPAHWQRARINALQTLGLTNTEIIRDYIQDTESAYAERLSHLTEADLDKLFQSPDNEEGIILFDVTNYENS